MCCKVALTYPLVSDGTGMFKLMRFYSTTSFVVIFVAAVLLTLFYRQVTINWIDHLARTNNLAVAQTALSSVDPELADYLSSMSDSGRNRTVSRSLPDEVASHLYRVTQNTTVDRIRIYTRNGVVIFSTLTEPVAVDQGVDPGFQSAINGNVFSSMVLRDTLQRLVTTGGAEDNRMRTFTPIRGVAGDPILGVFETRTDMSQLIEESDRLLFFILLGAELILALLYATLLFVVRHAKDIISIQHRTVQERAASLETLSRNILKEDELSKKRIATDLHEGLAQTLSAIKFNMESTQPSQTFAASGQQMETIVPVLQDAIQKVRTIATELRPSSLDELGLLPTLNWFCREFELHYPQISIHNDITLPEAAIPSHLKVEIYRIIESVFGNIAQHSNTDQISFALHLASGVIHLIISDTPTGQAVAATVARSDPGIAPQIRFAEMKERTSFSGGEFSVRTKESGGVTLRATWRMRRKSDAPGVINLKSAVQPADCTD